MKLTNLRALLRYNFRIVLGHTYWLIVIPVAATMLVLFMHMALKSLVAERTSLASKTVELLAPILATYLCVHVLGTEYRHRITELTFSKPYAAGRILLLRLLAIFLLVSFLMGVMLFIFDRGIYPDLPVRGIAGAAFPSTLFLAMLGLTVATLFRQPLVGLAFAGIYWGLDAYRGLELHPLLSLQAYAGHLAETDLAQDWMLSKGLLLGLGILLYLINGRLMVRPEGPRNWRTVGRSMALLVGILLVYLGTGAMCKVAYGARQERERPHLARLWYRERFKIYAPLPMARLFGSPFVLYLGRLGQSSEEGGEALMAAGRTSSEVAMLRRVVEQYPRSRWADNALYELARIMKASATREAEGPLQSPLEAYRRLAEQYPNSVFVPPALEEMAALAQNLGDEAAASWAQERLLTRYPEAAQAGPAAEAWAAAIVKRGRPEEMNRALQLVEQGLKAASPGGKPRFLGAAGDLLVGLNRLDEARRCYAEAAQGMEQLLREHREEVKRREDMSQKEYRFVELQRIRDDYLRKKAALR